MPFIEPQITGKQKWYQIDGNCGITNVPFEVIGKASLRSVAKFRDYYEGSDIYRVELVIGYGARLSAPGYMDCTEWSVFDTRDEAEAYLQEMYGDEEN